MSLAKTNLFACPVPFSVCRSLSGVPLCVVGTILGRNWSGTPNAPCRVNAIPRLIPDKRWYATPPVLIGLGGVLH